MYGCFVQIVFKIKKLGDVIMKKKFISILTTVIMIITLVAVCFPNEAFFWLSITADAINTRSYGDLTYRIFSNSINLAICSKLLPFRYSLKIIATA